MHTRKTDTYNLRADAKRPAYSISHKHTHTHTRERAQQFHTIIMYYSHATVSVEVSAEIWLYTQSNTYTYTRNVRTHLSDWLAWLTVPAWRATTRTYSRSLIRMVFVLKRAHQAAQAVCWTGVHKTNSVIEI